MWQTADELKFISSLGGHRDRPVYVYRAKLLNGYVHGLRHRQDWGLLDRLEVLHHALAELDLAKNRWAHITSLRLQGLQRFR